MKINKLLFAAAAFILMITLLICCCYAEDEEESSKQLEEGEIYEYDPVNGFPILNKTSIDGKIALLCSLDSDMILYAQEIDTQMAPASLAKIMTVLVAYENSSMDEMVTINSSAFNGLEYDWSGILSAGDSYTMENMLYLIMLPSANEACNAVAEHISGSVSAFCELLNEKAAELGCTGTHFSNAHGIDDPGEYSTARDIMIITKAALQYPELEEIFYTAGHDLPAGGVSEAQRIRSTNYLISEYFTQRFYYSYARGIKTGYTANSGYSIVTTGSDGNINLLCIVSGCESKLLTAGEYDIYSYSSAKTLLRYGFKYFEELTVMTEGVPVGELPVENGDQVSVVVAPMKDASIALPTGYSRADLRTEVYGTVTAPAKAGDVVGTASLYYRDIKIATVDVTPVRDVDTAEEAGNTPTETVLIEQIENEKKKFPVMKLLLILILLAVLSYAGLYLYVNLARKKLLPEFLMPHPKRKKSKKKKRKRKTQKKIAWNKLIPKKSNPDDEFQL